MKTTQKLLMLVLVAAGFHLISGFASGGPKKQKHYIRVRNAAELKQLFHYSADGMVFVSSHRGGPMAGFPENCIATFEHTLTRTWSIMEMDPHYTKDSVLVVMHDPTLNRTSNGTGRIADHTLAEIRQLKLKDTQGKLTGYGISTLDEVIEWAKGKTLLMMDAKEVPIQVRARKIVEHHAETSTMLIAYSFEDAKKAYAISKDILMEVMVPDETKLRSFDSCGVPWSNVVAFVTHTQPGDPGIFQKIHEKGALCIMGSSRTIDKAFTKSGSSDTASLKPGYQAIIKAGADIIEADFGIAAGEAVHEMANMKSPKSRFFRLE